MSPGTHPRSTTCFWPCDDPHVHTHTTNPQNDHTKKKEKPVSAFPPDENARPHYRNAPSLFRLLEGLSHKRSFQEWYPLLPPETYILSDGFAEGGYIHKSRMQTCSMPTGRTHPAELSCGLRSMKLSALYFSRVSSNQGDRPSLEKQDSKLGRTVI